MLKGSQTRQKQHLYSYGALTQLSHSCLYSSKFISYESFLFFGCFRTLVKGLVIGQNLYLFAVLTKQTVMVEFIYKLALWSCARQAFIGFCQIYFDSYF